MSFIKRLFVSFLFIAFLSPDFYAQSLSRKDYSDSLNNYLIQYQDLKVRYVEFENHSYMCFEKAAELNRLALTKIDSAKWVLAKIPNTVREKKKAEYKNQAALLYDYSAKLYRSADSLKKVAVSFSDSSGMVKSKTNRLIVNIEKWNDKVNNPDSAFQYQLPISDSLMMLMMIQNPSVKTKDKFQKLKNLSMPSVFVVQIGAGNMSPDYFSKVKDVNVYMGKDGIKRYTVGEFITKEDARFLKDKMIRMGFSDSFIRYVDPEFLKKVK